MSLCGCDFCSTKGLRKKNVGDRFVLYGKMQQSRGLADSSSSGLKMTISAAKLKALYIQMEFLGKRLSKQDGWKDMRKGKNWKCKTKVLLKVGQ